MRSDIFFIKVSIKDAILHIYTPLKSMVRAVTSSLAMLT